MGQDSRDTADAGEGVESVERERREIRERELVLTARASAATDWDKTRSNNQGNCW